MIEHINIIDALGEQISSLLDLMQMSEECVDHQSIRTAAEMALTMFDELMFEVEKIESEWRDSKEAEDDK